MKILLLQKKRIQKSPNALSLVCASGAHVAVLHHTLSVYGCTLWCVFNLETTLKKEKQ